MKITDPNSISLKAIKNIIFDWGGVVINIDYFATSRAFKDLGIQNFDEAYSQAAQNHTFDDLETGKATPAEFRDTFRKEFNTNITDEQLDHAWCAMLFDIPIERVKLLQELGKKYRIFLLSNTNQIHVDGLIEPINNSIGLDFFSLFEKVYLSHEVGMRKPDIEIFEHVIKENNLVAEETLFIDDSEQHIDSAAKTDLNAFFLKKGLTITDVFKLWQE